MMSVGTECRIKCRFGFGVSSLHLTRSSLQLPERLIKDGNAKTKIVSQLNSWIGFPRFKNSPMRRRRLCARQAWYTSESLSNQLEDFTSVWVNRICFLEGSLEFFTQLTPLHNLQLNTCDPGRTFLGKRRYFSGIAALTPLTPLTYKQNAVNAFIPTSKTPLTPLYRQKNAVNAAIFPVNNGFCG